MQHMDDDAGFRPVRHALCQHHASTRPTSKQANHAEPPVPKLHTNLHQMNMRQKWLTPILGPTATLVLHRLARYLTNAPECAFTTGELAATFGLANTDGTPSPGFTRALHQLQMFGMARTIGSHTEIRLIIPPLSQRHVGRIPAYLRAAYPWPMPKA